MEEWAGVNLYAFVNNSPVSLLDILGLQTVTRRQTHTISTGDIRGAAQFIIETTWEVDCDVKFLDFKDVSLKLPFSWYVWTEHRVILQSFHKYSSTCQHDGDEKTLYVTFIGQQRVCTGIRVTRWLAWPVLVECGDWYKMGEIQESQTSDCCPNCNPTSP